GERIAQAQEIPLKFLENILGDLRHAGIVRSQRGVEGGYWLARSADAISVADVVRAVEGGPIANVRGRGPEEVEYAGSAGPLQLQRLHLLARQLRREALAVVADELHPHLEAEVDESLDHRLLRQAVRLL